MNGYVYTVAACKISLVCHDIVFSYDFYMLTIWQTDNKKTKYFMTQDII